MSNYARYLTDLQDIYRDIARRAAGPDAHLIVNVANLHGTRLAWDVGDALAEVLTFVREIVIDWDRPQDWFTQDYCLIFQPRPMDDQTRIRRRRWPGHQGSCSRGGRFWLRVADGLKARSNLLGGSIEFRPRSDPPLRVDAEQVPAVAGQT